MEKLDFTTWLEKVSTWTRPELENALWAWVSDEENNHDAAIKIMDARDYLMGADPDDPQNFERLFEILGYQKNGLHI